MNCKNWTAALACCLAVCLAGAAFGQDSARADFYSGGAPHAEALGWHIGCQAYSFNRFTFYEAIDKTASMGLHCIEAYPGQKLSAEMPDKVFDHSMPAELQQIVLDRLKASKVKLMNYGVVGLPNDEAECRKIFDFAKAMGIETIVSEPTERIFDLLDKLTEEYGINVALHNHPKPSRYWDPAKVVMATKGHSKRIGACADTGHWMRSGINPLDAVKMLEGRIISFHIKDLNKYGTGGEHDVPWGQGEADITAILAEMHRQGFKGVFSAEYEHNWDNSVPDIAEGVRYVDGVAAALAQAGK